MGVPKRILVVDDEPLQLKATLNLLADLAPEWEAQGVASGSLGLQAFARKPYEAVLADLRMPGMDGAEFLQEIMARYPATIRFVLFKKGERNQSLLCLGWAHQFLAKPIEPRYLKSILGLMCTTGSRVENLHVRELVARITQLPAVPNMYAELNALLETPFWTTEQLGKVIAKDMAMTAMILKLANSAFFSVRQPVSSAAEAASYLGIDLLKALILARGIFTQVGAFRIPTFTIQHLWIHSLSVAGAAKHIAETEGAGTHQAVDCFTAGMLHDIGLLILASRFPEEYVKVLDLTRHAGGDLEAAEHHIFGATHGQVGAYLLALWGLPAPVIEAAAYHHAPNLQTGTGFTPTLAVHAANALHSEKAEHEIFSTAQLDLGYLAATGFLDRVPDWRSAAHSVVTS